MVEVTQKTPCTNAQEASEVENWAISCGEWDWAMKKAYFTLEEYPKFVTELSIQFDIENFGTGNPLADNPDDYYGGIHYNWWFLDDNGLSRLSNRDKGLVVQHIDDCLDYEINYKTVDIDI